MAIGENNMEKDLIDLCKYLIGYILRENDQLKKENKELVIKLTSLETRDKLLQDFANGLLPTEEDDDDEDEDEPTSHKFAA
jgi:hypothetical protein